MSSYKVDNLFLEAFGLKVDKAYAPEVGSGLPQNTPLDYGNIEIVDADEATEMSFLGTPIIYPITFKGQKYKTYNNDGEVVMKRMDDFRLPISCIVNFDRAKIIGKTKINNNAGGTVKETFGFEDWKVTIRGFCVADPSQKQGFETALDQERELMQWEQLVDSIRISGHLFTIRDISNIVIEKIPMNAMRGKPNIKPFAIHALSDKPLELIL